MAKTRSIVQISGTIGGMTHVDSKAYGQHVRAKRGTHTPVTLADGMKESATNQSQANLMAKLIFDTVNEFAPGFKKGEFWSRLVSTFRKQKKAGNAYNYASFEGIEMRLDYPTSKHGYFTLNREDGAIKIAYRLCDNNCYRLRLLRIAADETLLLLHSKEIVAVETGTDKKEGTVEFNFTALPERTAALYVLQCEQLEDGKPTGLLKGRSVRFL